MFIITDGTAIQEVYVTGQDSCSRGIRVRSDGQRATEKFVILQHSAFSVLVSMVR